MTLNRFAASFALGFFLVLLLLPGTGATIAIGKEIPDRPGPHVQPQLECVNEDGRITCTLLCPYTGSYGPLPVWYEDGPNGVGVSVSYHPSNPLLEQWGPYEGYSLDVHC